MDGKMDDRDLRLLVQPTILLWLILPWLDIFPNRHLLLGFHNLIDAINRFYLFNLFERSRREPLRGAQLFPTS